MPVQQEPKESTQNPDEVSRREFVREAATALGAAGLIGSFSSCAATPEGDAGEDSFEQRDDSFEYLIVGAGLVGAASAYYLSQSSSGVAVIGTEEPEDYAKHPLQGLSVFFASGGLAGPLRAARRHSQPA